MDVVSLGDSCAAALGTRGELSQAPGLPGCPQGTGADHVD